MKQKSILGTGTSALLIAVLAVLAFVRGPHQTWFLVGVFAVWGVWMITAALLSNKTAIQVKIHAHQQKKRRITENKKAATQHQTFHVSDVPDSVGLVLLRHVSYRISAYLKSAYPDVTWEWVSDTPERIITRGGTTRIRLFGIPDFNYADVMFDRHANIDCDMLRIVPLAQLNMPGDESEPVKIPPQPPVDPTVWYDLQGRQVLEKLVADLNPRGHSSLTIKENGDICIRQADVDVEQDKFKSFPAKAYWPGIAKVLENAGLAASVEDNGIVVSW